MQTRFDVIIIGGGQAGLAMEYYLAERGLDFLILDAGLRTGDSWRRRWDSLALFTPAQYSSLPGMAFPAEATHRPNKDEVADYLESYARRFALPIQHGQKVIKVEYLSEWRGFMVETTSTRFEADQVVVATGPFHHAKIPDFARRLDDSVLQLHSSTYKSAAQLRDGNTLVVGSGNSGVQIAAEVARRQPTWHSTGARKPVLPHRFLHKEVFWWLNETGYMSVGADTKVGQFARRREFLIGTSAERSARKNGVVLAGRAREARGNVIVTAKGEAIEVSDVIWATGFKQDFSWIEAPIFDEKRHFAHRRGVTRVRGLYFLGLPWLHTRGSALLGWVGRDAKHLAQQM